MLTGVTATTAQKLQLGAGVICTGYTVGGTVSGIIGATRGGGSFTAVPTVRQPEADGIPTNVAGLKIIDEWVATLNATLLEVDGAGMRLALGAATATTAGTLTTILAQQGIVSSVAHADIWWVGNLADGNLAAIKLSKAMNAGGLNLTFADKGEGTYTLQAVAHYSIDALTTPPFAIYIDKSIASFDPIALVSIAPADGSTGAATTVALTFNNAVDTDSVFITLASTGAIIAGTKAYDTTKKILTFTPTSAFAAALHIVNIVGVRDIYGQNLAVTTKSFTVA